MKTQGQVLQDLYDQFQKDRPHLSQRAFAKYVGIDSSRFHDFMTDKRVMTSAALEKVCLRLKLNAESKEHLTSAVSALRARKKRKAPAKKLSMADFCKISDWYYFAILALADTLDFKSQAEWVAQRLNISHSQAHQALGDLTELGLLKYENEKYSLTETDIETEDDIPSDELRKSHKQSLERVLKEISEDNVLERNLQSVTFAGDPKKLKQANRLILQLTQKVVAAMESGRRTEVYELNVQLFPVTKKV